jgi:hypothetical protein
MAPEQMQFRALFCQRYNCQPSDYQRKAFFKLLYPHAKLVAPVLGFLIRDLFAEDYKFIAFLGDATGFRDASVDVLNFSDVNRGNPSVLRTGLRIRVSGRKATRLAKQLFSARRASLEVK